MLDRPPVNDGPVSTRRAASAARRPPARGFSLLELMVTLAIGAILLGLALPSMSGLLGGSKTSATVNDLVFALQSARSEAIKRAAPVVLCPSADPLDADAVCAPVSYADGWIVFVDDVDDVDGVRDADEELVLQSEPRDASFTLTTPGGTFASRVLFTATGTSANPAGVPLSGTIRIVQSAGPETREVRVAANGRVSSSTP